MITVEEALNIVLSTANHRKTAEVSLLESIGRTLAEDIYTDRPMPPFDRVTMDGIAINAQYYRYGMILTVEGIQAAGSPQLILKENINCIEVMTGASLPHGTDTVIRYEDLDSIDDGYMIMIDVVKGKNVHVLGSDYARNEIILGKGTTLKAIDINILASVGKSTLRVFDRPTVAVISSGDELVEITDIPKDYQIRKSNVYMVLARLKELGISGDAYHLVDEKADIKEKLATILEQYDVIIMSGGVSKGKYDFIPEVLDELGIEKLFHGVAQRPGKPFWFGKRNNKSIFAFPGNPVSTLACFHKYFISWFAANQLNEIRKIMVELGEDVSFNRDLHYLALAKIKISTQGIISCTVIRGNGSGDIASPSKADGFLELPRGKDLFRKGEWYSFIPFHPIIQ